ncbi:hypothetical protein [Ahrensia sp. 13_GOM-1096m]|uniref:hypothetical protein n=1 Tax=Ahrensia sp. 13_GOM-1096m TaxID=1380380 RepID=UPI00047C7581|nr:hypothetical protein [Ahrensia sp. 13_GOM-1096m]
MKRFLGSAWLGSDALSNNWHYFSSTIERAETDLDEYGAMICMLIFYRSGLVEYYVFRTALFRTLRGSKTITKQQGYVSK